MSERFSDQMRRECAPLWEAQHRHPFVVGLGDGSLEPERFHRWLAQDYLYLIEYVRLFALIAARAPDREAMTWAIDMAHNILRQEMWLHEAYAIEFGFAREEIMAAKMLPTTRAYTDYLLRLATLGSFVQILAAMLPCMWGYWEIAHRIASQPPQRNRYSRWLDLYSGPASAEIARKGRDLLDRFVAEVGEPARAAAAQAFVTSSRYEVRFWNMCYEGESWGDHWGADSGENEAKL
jgi:thiaminase/transcriptional activator TenA